MRFLKLMNILKINEYGRTILLLKKTCGMEEGARKNLTVGIIFLLNSGQIQNRARTQIILLFTYNACLQLRKWSFSCFLTIFIIKYVYITKNFIQFYFKININNGKLFCRRGVTIFLFSDNVILYFFMKVYEIIDFK